VSKKAFATVVVFDLAALTFYQRCACDAEGERVAASKKPDPNAASVGVTGESSSWNILPMAKDDTCRWTETLRLKLGNYPVRTIQKPTRRES
jgi:hypothetical protein